ncbi:hypothetical protein BASA60_002142 [Batrachochytrium salamandrivorans]|nr:hypothetical protein BASA60_002142 [Batrachochytrium salamandrivorans]
MVAWAIVATQIVLSIEAYTAAALWIQTLVVPRCKTGIYVYNAATLTVQNIILASAPGERRNCVSLKPGINGYYEITPFSDVRIFDCGTSDCNSPECASIRTLQNIDIVPSPDCDMYYRILSTSSQLSLEAVRNFVRFEEMSTLASAAYTSISLARNGPNSGACTGNPIGGQVLYIFEDCVQLGYNAWVQTIFSDLNQQTFSHRVCSSRNCQSGCNTVVSYIKPAPSNGPSCTVGVGLDVIRQPATVFRSTSVFRTGNPAFVWPPLIVSSNSPPPSSPPPSSPPPNSPPSNPSATTSLDTRTIQSSGPIATTGPLVIPGINGTNDTSITDPRVQNGSIFSGINDPDFKHRIGSMSDPSNTGGSDNNMFGPSGHTPDDNGRVLGSSSISSSMSPVAIAGMVIASFCVVTVAVFGAIFLLKRQRDQEYVYDRPVPKPSPLYHPPAPLYNDIHKIRTTSPNSSHEDIRSNSNSRAGTPLPAPIVTPLSSSSANTIVAPVASSVQAKSDTTNHTNTVDSSLISSSQQKHSRPLPPVVPSPSYQPDIRHRLPRRKSNPPVDQSNREQGLIQKVSPKVSASEIVIAQDVPTTQPTEYNIEHASTASQVPALSNSSVISPSDSISQNGNPFEA